MWGEVEFEYFILVNTAAPGRYLLLNGNLSAGHELPVYDLLVKEVSEAPKILHRVLPLLLVAHQNSMTGSYH